MTMAMMGPMSLLLLKLAGWALFALAFAPVTMATRLTAGVGGHEAFIYEELDDIPRNHTRAARTLAAPWNSPWQLHSASKMANGPGCRRSCDHGAKSRVCRYRFVLQPYSTMGAACLGCPLDKAACFEPMCNTADGVERATLVINRRLPGPSIQVCQGDTVVVDLENRMPGASTTIHWHGVLQKGSPYMDGVPMLTQCPILEGNTFRYIYTADDLGTYFWHSHVGLQKMDGVAGSMVVRSSEDPSWRHYDWDLHDHVVMLQDWMHHLTMEKLPGPRVFRRGQQPNAILINGRGRFQDPVSGNYNNIPLSEFHVTPGFRYRFRIIHAGCLVCPLQLQFQGHRMTLIATDSSPVRPMDFDTLVILPGERYDVVIRSNRHPAAYWIHVKTLGDCEPLKIHQMAILRYEGASEDEPYFPHPRYEGFEEGVVLNPLNSACTGDGRGVCVSQLTAQVPPLVPSTFLTTSNVLRFTINFDFHVFTFEEQFRTKQYMRYYHPSPMDVMIAGQVNKISLTMPPAPPLSQPEVLAEECARGSSMCCLPESSEQHRECFNVVEIPLNAVVELLLLDSAFSNGTITHPIHLHGYMFTVLTMGTLDQRNRGLAEDPNFTLQNPFPAKKDTVALPSGGFAKLRFVAKNPGYWLMHCHFSFHLESGMGIVFKVGEQSDMPPVPPDFPRCGNYKPGW